MPARRPYRIASFAVSCALVLTIAGCAAGPVTWVDEDTEYTRDEVRDLSATIKSGNLADTPTDDAVKLRHDALTDLRSKGGDAAKSAELVTATFDADTRAVPYYVERARFDGRDVVVVIEAWGTKTGDLSFTRTWVLDASTGDVLDTSSGR